MESLISLVNKIQRACTALGDHGEGSSLPTLWDSLPAIAVVGGQVFVLSSTGFLAISVIFRSCPALPPSHSVNEKAVRRNNI